MLRELKKTKNSELNLGLFGSSNEEMYDDSRTFKVNEMVFGPSNVWNVPKPRNNKDHPTMKPLELLSKAILYSSKPGDWVLDPFAGSGSTLIAAHALNRKCYTIELDPAYVDVIVDRFKNAYPDETVKHLPGAAGG